MKSILSRFWTGALVAFLPVLRYNTTTETEFFADLLKFAPVRASPRQKCCKIY
jgi:hypothetical protein